jgi:hypothetical protein
MALTPDEHGRRTSAGAYARMTPEHRRRRARAAALSRHHPEQATDDRRQLKADAAERYVRELVDQWPPLSDEQRARIAALLTDQGKGEADGHAT